MLVCCLCEMGHHREGAAEPSTKKEDSTTCALSDWTTDRIINAGWSLEAHIKPLAGQMRLIDPRTGSGCHAVSHTTMARMACVEEYSRVTLWRFGIKGGTRRTANLQITCFGAYYTYLSWFWRSYSSPEIRVLENNFLWLDAFETVCLKPSFMITSQSQGGLFVCCRRDLICSFC